MTAIDDVWRLEGRPGQIAVRFGWRIAEVARVLIAEKCPDLADAFPFDHQFQGEAEVDSDGWIAIRIRWQPGRQTPMAGAFSNEDSALLHEHLELFNLPFLDQLAKKLGPNWLGPEVFTYVGPISNDCLVWPHLYLYLTSWLDLVAERALELNRQRVLRAIPSPPSYNLAKLFPALWILECEETNIQGTAFALADVGLVTCHHSLGASTRAFQYDAPNQKYSIVVRERNSTIDLAVLELPADALTTLAMGSADAAQQMEHVLVMGHPNYRVGDTPVTIPGLVVGFRTVSGVRRLLTNAAIVAGCSGGPVLDSAGKVIGIAVTGSDKISTQNRTEDHACIPIEALKLIGT
ncbi:MAG: serine protease [Reyranella sp.]|uniref:S1 family peptidase n=1 Tax=Reyranella sp. TaxID=1929291 RepID=UPI0011FC6240|nr:serine protease [Reyranella sp.]TAJ37856.1 MAG: serine protease [Reyranella sp.]